ncbi:MAG: hypothetical protein AAF824_04985 [Bacteroidota bacterium]
MKFIFLLFLLLFLGCSPTQQEPKGVEEMSVPTDQQLEEVQQLIVVTTEGWNTLQAVLSLYEGYEGAWTKVGESIPAVVGTAGLAWGRGENQQRFQELEGPVKKEGDKRSPAGVFDLPLAFGYAEKASADFVDIEYVHVSSYIQCIEDISSAYYNQIVPDSLPDADWDSSDRMLRKDDLYEWGVLVGHNYPRPTPGGGSCIFLHVWRDAEHGTLGCTAMDKSFLKDLLTWLSPDRYPQLVQMPAEYYDMLAAQEGWP